MDLTESYRNSVLPTDLYTSIPTKGPFSLSTPLSKSSPAAGSMIGGRRFIIPSPSESGKAKIEMYSLAFYAACTTGGILSCGLTHMAVTPLDLVKCNMQIDPTKYKSISSGFGVLLRE